jgi:general nucleoside transport system permease protein
LIIRLERRLAPANSVLAILLSNAAAIAAALILGGLLFLPFHISPFEAYADLVGEAFLSWRGIGYTSIEAASLILVGLGTIFAWRTGFAYLGFQGCLTVGAIAAAWLALRVGPGDLFGDISLATFLPIVLIGSFAAGCLWSGLVGFARARFGGTEVLVSLMMNYVAALLVQYLVSGPMRAPGDLPQTSLMPRSTWLPYIMEGTRANIGILIALGAAVVVWILLNGTVAGYEMIVTGLNPRAARFGGIDVGGRTLLASGVCGGLAALAGPVEILGNQHRLLDGVGEGLGFIGIVAALLGKLTVGGTVVASILYGGLSVGGNAMQRHSGLPSSLVLVEQALIVLLVLASDLLRRYRISWVRGAPNPREVA